MFGNSDGDWLLWGVLTLMWKSMVGCFHLIVSILSGIFSLFKPRIERENEKRRMVVNERKPVSVAKILEGKVIPGGKIIVSGDAEKGSLNYGEGSGNVSPWRNTVIAQCAAQMAQTGLGGVILHHSNEDLIARMQHAVGAEKVICVGRLEEGPRVYDPLASCEKITECADILMDFQDDGSAAFSSAKDYLDGLLLMINRVVKKRPTIYLLNKYVNMNYERLADILADAQSSNLITEDLFVSINDKLSQNMTDGRSLLKRRLNKLYSQLGEMLINDTPVPNSSRISMAKAVKNGSFLLIDLEGIADYKLCCGLLVNEMKKAVETENKGAYFAVEDIELSACDGLQEVMRTKQNRLCKCLSGEDLFASCGSAKEKVHSILSGCSCCFIFKHDGDSACFFQNYFGKFKKMVVTRNEGMVKSRGPFQLFSGTSLSRGQAVAEQDEFRVREEQITALNQGCAFVRRNDSDSILHCVLSDQ